MTTTLRDTAPMQDEVTRALVASVAVTLPAPYSARAGVDADRDDYIELSFAALATYARSAFGLDDATIRRGITEDFAPATLTLITRGATAAGVLVVEARPDELWLDQIVLAAVDRDHGLGAVVIQAVQATAAARGVSVALSVLDGNPARSLYARLGFAIERIAPPRTFMRWSPDR